MKRLASLAVCFSLATAALFAPALTATAGAEEAPVTTTETVAETYKQEAERVISEADLPEDQKVKLRALMQALPDDADQRVAALNEKLGASHTVWSEIADSVINPEDYTCAPTPAREWLDNAMAEWGILGVIIFSYTPIGELPMYDALLFGSENKDNTFGANGEYTSLLTSEMKDLRSFWDISGDIELIPMHGSDVYKDPARLWRVLSVIFGPSWADELAPLLQAFVDAIPGFRGGDHPAFSYNAFALDPTGDPELEALGVTSKMIVMGDGVMEGLAGIGIDTKVGPRSILAHEYGHQVQFAKNLFDTPLTGAEATRRTELMADAFATYFMVHSRGEALNAVRTLDDQKSFFNVGDCNYSSDGHHGTPNQRFNAAAWAATVVNQAANQGIVAQLGGSAFAAKFDAKLPELVAPDAP
jgi:hypothetical protein